VEEQAAADDTSSSMTEPPNLRLTDLLAATADALADGLAAEACTVSRAIGDVLILVVEHAPPGTTLLQGQGYLVSDFPLTQEVLASGRSRALTVADGDADPAEVTVLHELGFASLLMLPLTIAGATWGLVEVYRLEPVPFDDDDVRAASEILGEAGRRAG
jgi:GAF domain-containing protein